MAEEEEDEEAEADAGKAMLGTGKETKAREGSVAGEGDAGRNTPLSSALGSGALQYGEVDAPSTTPRCGCDAGGGGGGVPPVDNTARTDAGNGGSRTSIVPLDVGGSLLPGGGGGGG